LCIIGVLVIGILSCLVALELKKRKGNEIREYEQSEFSPTYQGDIMEYKKYLDLDRSVKYCADPSGYGMTQAITEENQKDFDAGVLFLRDYIQTIVAGDAEAYNACFSEAYFEHNDPQKSFTPQMVYGSVITYLSEQTDGDSKLVTYKLEYMIFENDGSFRRDILSNASREQRVTLRLTPSGQITIEKLITVNHQVS
jgi:hypothetical protein